MDRLKIAACFLLICSPLALTRHDDDFAFDNSDETVDLTVNHSGTPKNGLRRLWGVPDTSAYVGHLFRMEIPKEAFSGEVVAYKVRRDDGRRTPSWLAVDTKHGLISGVPLIQDVGPHSFTVTAHGRTAGHTASDSFIVEVKKSEDKSQSKYGSCKAVENRLVLILLVDAPFNRISPRQRTRALMELSNFMALDGNEFSIEPYKAESARDQLLLMSGPGNALRRRGDATTAIYFNVGCGEKLWSRHKVLVAGLREQSRDGTLAHLLRLPVLGWRLIAVRPPPRNKRQLPKSEDAVYNDGSGNDDDGDADYSGDYDYDDENDDFNNSDDYDDNANQDVDHKVKIAPYPEAATEASNINITKIVSPRLYSPPIIPEFDIPTTTEPETQTVIIRASNEVPPSSSEAPPTYASSPPPEPTFPEMTSQFSEVTSPSPPTTTETITTYPTTPTTLPTPAIVPATVSSTTQQTLTTDLVETTNEEVTEQEIITSTDRASTIIGQTSETVNIPLPGNQPPTLKHHMKKLGITAGKAFRYIIPTDLFTDPEDGNNLTFSMYDDEHRPLSKNSWIQFNPVDREVYGLPLESHVSRWNFEVEARDSEGAIAKGPLDITVQQHKIRRTINHQFKLQFRLNKAYDNDIDWQIRALEGIVNLFRYTDMDRLTVLNFTQNADVCEFVWTNDTLPKDVCPLDDINQVMKILEAQNGNPSAGLARAMSPELKVDHVSWEALGKCLHEVTAPPATKVPDTYPPVPRNQVDHIRATTGHLLVYKVPEDTFYDPEDGDTRNLQLSLRASDRSELPASHWLQFDSNNQEFYGLPGPRDVGKLQYQLVAKDSSKKTAYDSLIIEVDKAAAIRPTVEFQMTIEYPYQKLSNSASIKRKVVEKLAQLFGETDTSSIRVQSITDSPTTITWYNTSLPMDRCPNDEIQELRQMIIDSDKGTNRGELKENVDRIFDKDFKVMSIRLIPLGLCADQDTKTSKNTPVQVGVGNTLDSKAGSAQERYNDYLVTFVIPAVVVVCMIIIAGIIACVLYRRRRTGKMSVGDEEERQAFRSKGIPVIFQDELEEQAATEPLHKSPVIMREEKPPLLPPAPDYRTSAPYRPPPPVAPATTPPRPKATPTYRKPPPYVPP